MVFRVCFFLPGPALFRVGWTLLGHSGPSFRVSISSKLLLVGTFSGHLGKDLPWGRQRLGLEVLRAVQEIEQALERLDVSEADRESLSDACKVARQVVLTCPYRNSDPSSCLRD